jgi:hypothetical protein
MATDQRNQSTVQLITFAIDVAPNADRKWMTVDVKHAKPPKGSHRATGQSVAAVAAARGHPEDARLIADYNGIRSIYSRLGRSTLKVPKDLAAENSFDVMPGDSAPQIVDGYAVIETVDRPQRTGLTMFTGYSPIAMDVPIRFESHYYKDGDRRPGQDIEDDIAKLELMAGRGIDSAAGTAPPPIIRVGVTRDGGKKTVPLIPKNYQFDRNENPHAPVWRINGIDWDSNPIRNRSGNRIRQLATVHLVAHTRLSLLQRSASTRTRSKPKPKAKRGSKPRRGR